MTCFNKRETTIIIIQQTNGLKKFNTIDFNFILNFIFKNTNDITTRVRSAQELAITKFVKFDLTVNKQIGVEIIKRIICVKIEIIGLPFALYTSEAKYENTTTSDFTAHFQTISSSLNLYIKIVQPPSAKV